MSNDLVVDHYRAGYGEGYSEIINLTRVDNTKRLRHYIEQFRKLRRWKVVESLQHSFGPQSLLFEVHYLCVPNVLVAKQSMSLKESCLLVSLAKRCQGPMRTLSKESKYTFVHFTDFGNALGMEAVLQTTLIGSCRLFVDKINS